MKTNNLQKLLVGGLKDSLKLKGVLALGLFALVFLFSGEANAQSSYWKNYFSSEEQKAVQKNAERYTISEIESKSAKWKGLIRSFNIKNGSIKDEDIKENGIGTDKINGLGDYIDGKISGSSTPQTPQDFSADKLTGSYAALDGSQITDISPSNITGSGNLNIGNGDLFVDDASGNVGIGTTSPSEKLSIIGNGSFSGSLNVGDVVTTRNNLGLNYANSADIAASTFSSIAAWGDSLTVGTGGTPYPAQLATITGANVYNGGVGGETSTQIKVRMLATIDKYSYPTIIWMGRNNISSPDQIKADIAAMVAVLGHTRYIILGVTNSSTEPTGSTNYAFVTQLNNDLASIYGTHFIDIRSYLVSQYNASIPQDVTDHSNDIIPSSLRFDSVHLNTAGYLLIAQQVDNKIDLLIGGDNGAILTAANINSIFSNPIIKGSSGVTSFTGNNRLGIVIRGATGDTDYGGIDFANTFHSSNPLARIGMITGSTGSSLFFGTSNNWNNGITNNAMSIDSIGNIGVGISTPLQKLDVRGSALITGKLGIGGTDIPVSKLMITPVQTSGTSLANAFIASSDSSNPLSNNANSYQYPFELQQNNTGGSVERLQIAPYRRIAGNSWQGTAYRLQYAVDNSFTNGSKAFVEIGGSDPSISSGGFISLGTAGFDRLVVSDSGNVGIRTTTPVATLDVNGQVKIQKSSAQPFACDVAHDGTIALTSGYRTCVCKGTTTTWVFTTDGTTACTW